MAENWADQRARLMVALTAARTVDHWAGPKADLMAAQMADHSAGLTVDH